MAFINIGTGDDLVLEIPVKRTVDWADKLREDCFQRIVEHDHSGSGRGRPLSGEGIADNGIDDRKILLRNNEWLRSAGHMPGDPDVKLIRATGNSAQINVEIGPDATAVELGNKGLGVRSQSSGVYFYTPRNSSTDIILAPNSGDSAGSFGSVSVDSGADLRVNYGDLFVGNEAYIAGPLSSGKITTRENLVLPARNSDPISPDEGELMTVGPLHPTRAAGLWQYQGSQWVNIQGEVGANSVNTAAIQDEAVTEPKMADDSVSTRTIIDESVTGPKLADNSVSRDKISSTYIVGGSKDVTDQATANNIVIISTTSFHYYGRPLLLIFEPYADFSNSGLIQVTGGPCSMDVQVESVSPPFTTIFSQTFPVGDYQKYNRVVFVEPLVGLQGNINFNLSLVSTGSGNSIEVNRLNWTLIEL